MARALTQNVAVRVPVGELDDMRRTLAWFHDLLPETAREELAAEHARGNLHNETALVDGRKNVPLDSVKPFGKIVFAGGLGPIAAALMAAETYARAAAPRRTGHYASALQWFVNGSPVGGMPSAEQIGVRGNAELVDLAPYAGMVEIQVPRGVIFGAYTQLARQFGATLSIGFRFAKAAEFGGHNRKPGETARTFLNVPVLSIGHPVSTVRPGVARSRPGATQKKRRRQATRILGELRRAGRIV